MTDTFILLTKTQIVATDVVTLDKLKMFTSGKKLNIFNYSFMKVIAALVPAPAHVTSQAMMQKANPVWSMKSESSRGLNISARYTANPTIRKSPVEDRVHAIDGLLVYDHR